MRVVVVASIVAAATVHATAFTRVDGVRVYGKVDAVKLGDVRQAMAAFKDLRSDGRPPAAIEVVSSSEMRAYRPEQGMGWSPIKRMTSLADAHGQTHPEWIAWPRGIPYTSEAHRFMRRAAKVYVFPITFVDEYDAKHQKWLVPQPDKKRVRALGAAAQQDLVRIVGYEKGWFHGGDHTIWAGDVPTNVGFVFRRGTDELTLLFTTGWKARCILPSGEYLEGSLEEAASDKLERWKKQYAQRELAAK